MNHHINPDADALILFGASGDLARKKLLPAMFELSRAKRLEMPIIGVASSNWSNDDFIARIRNAVVESYGKRADQIDMAALDHMCQRAVYVSGDYSDSTTWQKLAAHTSESKVAVAFLAIPPFLFSDVVKGLDDIGLSDTTRVVVEKPFGRDFASARELNETLHQYLDESQIYRIDHFLGKEPVQNLMVFRFANSLLESVWNRNHIESVTVTMAESFGVEGRGRFYDEVGTIRDVVQNHLLQMVALLTMEPPASNNQQAFFDEKVKVFRAMRSIDPANVVRGQVEGYRMEEGVDPNSDTETFAAMKLEIDSWRWSGVPFYIRAGKSLGATLTEAVVQFKQPPRMLFTEDDHAPDPSRLRFEMKPKDMITLTMQAKVPGPDLVSQAVDMNVSYPKSNERQQEAYERLIGDAIQGDQRLFTRQDAVEEAWRVIDPILHDDRPAKLYRTGSWGPEEAAAYVPEGCGPK